MGGVLASGFWLLASGFWLLASGFWLLASGFWLLASGFWLLASGFWLGSARSPSRVIVARVLGVKAALAGARREARP
jgi:hypothetical protein